ncbi:MULTISPECIES: hypothetical protein [unclassified Bradyrhizobium]|uniref:hypothetical protein n=1 Tax=unclassified Bradyrhizobium TaxID=2631580 RepID=UPI002917021D|nr:MULTISPECIES: hypothetical protein [unclassified Bradyrhizobium]
MALFAKVRGKALPKPDQAGFDSYLDDLGQDVGPLFPWIGGELGFSFLWAAADSGTIPLASDPAGVTAVPIPIPTLADGSRQANFELSETALRGLLHAALADLVSAGPHTDRFTKVEPFKLFGWDDDGGAEPIDEIADDAGTNFRYQAFMAGLASLPAPVPHGRLNLVRFVQLSAVNPARGKRRLVVAAPRFKPRNTTVWLEPKFDAVSWKLQDQNIVATIPYQSDFGGHAIEVICRAIDLDEVLTGSASFLQRESLWVARRYDGKAGDSRDGVGFEDWLANLPELMADAFDLPRLLLQAMEDDIKATGSRLTAAIANIGRARGARLMTDATLLALRDIVGPGCIAYATTDVLKGPNGSPAHAAMIEQVNWAVKDYNTGSPLDAAAAKALSDAVREDDRRFRQGFGTGAGDAAPWFDILAGVLGPALELPATGEAFVSAIASRVAIDPAAVGAFDPSALRRVVDAAALPDNAAALQIALWRRANPGLETWFAAARDAFEALTSRGLRLVAMLRKANVDLPWLDEQGIWKKAADPKVPDIDALRGNIREAITAYVLGTVCEAKGTALGLEKTYQDQHGRMAQLPAGARADIAHAIDGVVKDRLANWFRTPEHDGVGTTLLKGDLAADAQPIALQIDRLVVGAGASPDFNEDIAGFGVLMRRSQPADDWRCLTATFGEINPDRGYGTGATEVTFETAPKTVMGALPVAYTSQMPQAIVMYDNRPIVGDSLADAPIEDQPGIAPPPRILRLFQPVVQDTPPAETLLPFLAYGATYEVAPFGISNHGALPEIIRRDDYPAILDPAKLKNPFPAGSAFVRQFSYLRQTGIGALHVAPVVDEAQKQGQAFHPMVLPKAVKPLAEEILVPARAVTPWDTRANLPNSALKLKTALLLADGDGNPLLSKPGTINCGELKLTVSAPVTPLEDFDRWIALEEATLSEPNRTRLRGFRKALRVYHQQQVFALHDKEAEIGQAVANENASRANALRKEAEAIRATLDLQDPAVGALAVAVTRVRRNGALPKETVADFKPELIDWSWTWESAVDPKKPFADKRKPIDFTCKVDKDVTKPVFDKSTRTISVAAGDVVVVHLFAAVPDELFSDPVAPGKRRFDSVVLEKAALHDGTGPVLVSSGSGAKYRLFAMHALAVEAASRRLPSDAELAAAIEGSIVGDVSVNFDEHTGDMRLDFKRAPSVAMDAVGDITVGSQAWRWTGRPLAPFPFSAARDLNRFPTQDPQNPGATEPPSPSEFALLWDVEGFAERLDETLDNETVAVAINERIVSVASTATSEPQPTRIALRSPARQDTARYMRFRVIAANRYAAAYAAARQLVAVQAAQWKSPSGKWTTPWYRLLRPAKQPDAVPKPGIRALIPLTRALREGDDVSPVAGVLAVVDGAWFEHAGLAEWMLAEVETAYRKRLMIAPNTTVARAAAEIGPDPLLRTYGLGQKEGVTPDHNALKTAVPLDVAGPLGHGFDTGTATGLYLNSSFIVRAPALAAADPTAWWMSKLVFRRYIVPEVTRDYWTKSVATPVTSATPQLSATLHAIGATANNAVLKFRAAGKLVFGKTPPQAEVVAQATWSGQSWTVQMIGGGVSDSFSVAEPTFDLRVLAVRRLSRVPPDEPQQYAWYEILVLVKPKGRAWRIAWQGQWFNDAKFVDGKDSSKAELEIDFVVESQTGVSIGEKRVSAALQVSEATEGRWTQFMPNAEAVRASKVPLTSLSLSVDPTSNMRLLLKSGGNRFAWLASNDLTGAGRRTAGKPDQGLVNLLLLTKRIASVAGTDEEAYVGLYDSAAGYDSAVKAVVLSWFGNAAPKLSDQKQLIGRILTVRLSNPEVQQSKIDEWKKDPWKWFFPAEDGSEKLDASRVFGERRPPDASAQIIEIYAPIPLTV